ncbi:hypothetical protein [Microlunatus sp. GCM10028923]|uniref:hypothetical protein n=1 Tax=Microlunatus sp. GCM10028923 TaxID=3273400 RepID=UPI0036179A5F
MRRVCWLIILIPLLVACGDVGSVHTSEEAGCAAPYLDDQPPGRGQDKPPPTVRPGATVEVYGHWYTSTCNDTGGNDPLKPLPDVELTLTLPGGESRSLGRHRPGGPDMGFKAVVRIPADTRSGTATIKADGSYPAEFRFKVVRP